MPLAACSRLSGPNPPRALSLGQSGGVAVVRETSQKGLDRVVAKAALVSRASFMRLRYTRWLPTKWQPVLPVAFEEEGVGGWEPLESLVLGPTVLPAETRAIPVLGVLWAFRTILASQGNGRLHMQDDARSFSASSAGRLGSVSPSTTRVPRAER